MFVIGEILVDDSVKETKFACDLLACKGACCTFPGGRGAPLRDNEIAEIEKAYAVVKEMLPPEHIHVVESYGLIDGVQGNYATQCVDGKACVFVYYDDGIARCAIERAYFNKKLEWQKPISCHLFPIRIGREGKEIHYEYFTECEPGLKRGKEENIPVGRFLTESLERTFGTAWTQELLTTIDTQ